MGGGLRDKAVLDRIDLYMRFGNATTPWGAPPGSGADIVAGNGRTSDDQISFAERGNLQGNQFWPFAGSIYELAKAKGRGHQIPTEWFLQDIRD